MVARLERAEAAGDEPVVAQRRGGGRVGGRAVQVAERGGLVDEDAAGEVLRQVHAGVERGLTGGVEYARVGRVRRGGQGAVGAYGLDEQPQAVPGRLGGDDE